MTDVKAEQVRALEFLMASIPNAKQREAALPHALTLIAALGGDPKHFAYLGNKKSSWARVNGAHEYLVEFEDGAAYQGDAFTYLVSERELSSFTGLASSSIQHFLQGGKTMRRDTKLGHAIVRRVTTTLTPGDRKKLLAIASRDDRVAGPKRGSGRRY